MSSGTVRDAGMPQARVVGNREGRGDALAHPTPDSGFWAPVCSPN